MKEHANAILQYSRAVLKASLEGGKEPVLQLEGNLLDEKRGIFVTLKQNGNLRGCIGLILSEEPLRQTIRDMTIAAAFQDPRFPPVALEELGSLRIHISILTAPRTVKSFKEIRLGKDGIIVSCGRKKGVYLPEVAVETGWNQETFFASCALEKAGLNREELQKAKIEVFQTEGFEEEGYV